MESSKMVPPSPKGSQQEIPVRNESASDFASSIRGKFATLKSTAISASPKRSQRGRPAKSRDESASDSESSVKDKASSKIVRPTARRGRPVISEDESESDSESSVKGKVATKSQPKVKKGKESSKMEPPQTVSTTEPTLPAAGTSKQMPKRKAKSNHLIFTSPDIFSGDRRKSDSKKMTESSTNVKKPARKKRPLSQDSNSDGSPRKKPNVSVEYSDSSDLKDKSQSDSSTTSVSRPARGKVTKPTASLCYENTSTDTENETEKETATKKGKKLDRKETSAEPRGSRSKSQKSGSLKRLSSENLSLEQPQVRRTRHASPSSSSVGSPRTSSQRSRCSSVSSVTEKKISETAADSKEKHVVVFSGYIDENQEKIVKKLGGEVVGTIPDGNCVLVVRNLGRTLKVLSMLARGLPIVKENWILDCQKARKFLDPWLYLIHDKPAEEKYGFSLRKCLEARRNSHPVFEGWTIMGTGSTKPPPLELQGVVENAGGKFITSRPKTWTNNSLVVTCDEDKSSWSQLSAKNAKQKPKLVKISAIWESIEHQTVITEGHEFHA
ncbi:hypothetical protein B566_EDAN006819 [Ephemera danica]|nr:hypothetical protein B566_EDAN006819 [Ephemera danica]